MKLLFFLILCTFSHSLRAIESYSLNAQNTYIIPYEYYPALINYFNSKSFVKLYASNKLSLIRSVYNSNITYYDTSDLTLLKNQVQLSLVEINYDETQKYQLEKNKEVIFQKGNQYYKYDLRKNNKAISSIDKHSLLGKVKRTERERLLQSLTSLGILNIHELEQTITSKAQTLANYLYHNNKQVGVIYISHISSVLLGNEVVIIKVDIIFNKLTTEIETLDQKLLLKTLENNFFEIGKNKVILINSNSYQAEFDLLIKQAGPYIQYFLQNQTLYKLLQAFFYGLLGLGLLSFFFKRRLFSEKIH